jgi:putative ABC transport system substrate-binding protein
MNPRKIFIVTLALGILVAPLAADAQRPTKVPRVGFLGASTPALADHLLQAFIRGLRELGYVEGQNIVIERRFADGKLDRLPALAAELVNFKVDVIFAPPTTAALAAKKATSAIPIVFALVGDPVGTGFVASLARPGGNMTGLSTINVELGAKRLELLKEAFPTVSRVAVLLNPIDPSNVLQLKETQRAAHALGMQLLPIEAQRPEDFDPAFLAMAAGRADALLVMENPINFTHRKLIVDLSNKSRRPAMHALTELVDAGGLMSYSVSYPDQFRRAATYVDKILKGAKPGDLPVEQPTKFELVINLKTAKALGLTIPPSLLFRADQVIQ